MEMGKLTAKLRDAVPVCLLVDGKEIKRYKNIEIPDELKKLELHDFKFDAPLNGSITFKIMFEPGVLPEVFPEMRERRTRKTLAQEAQAQEKAPVVDKVAGAVSQMQDEQAAEALPASAVEAFAQALEDAQATGEPMTDIAAAMADGEAIKTEIIKGEGKGQLLVITSEPERTETKTQAESDVPAKKPVNKGRGKKGATTKECAYE